MAFNPQQLLCRNAILDRGGHITFHWLKVAEAERDMVLPLMMRLANMEELQADYILPAQWIQDEILLGKISKKVVLVVPDDPAAVAVADKARALGYRTAHIYGDNSEEARPTQFELVPFGQHGMRASASAIVTGIETPEEYRQTLADNAAYCSGKLAMLPTPTASSRRINPSHALILELMSAVQQEMDTPHIEGLLKRDVTLSFKLLRYINSPGFGLFARVESVRHALSIIGYQLALLAITASNEASPALTQAAIIRARFMELIGARKLEKSDADNLFVTGMLSLLDRMTGVPLANILPYANLPPAISEALLQEDGRYLRFLRLAQACEGSAALDEADADIFSDMDLKAVNFSHLEALEWSAGIIRNA